MGSPIEVLQNMLDDASVLSVVANSEYAPVTTGVLDSVARWFHDVEIMYPIAEMEIDAREKRSLTRMIADELVLEFGRAVKLAAAGSLDDEAFEELARKVDPLWRELSGVYAKELNEAFAENSVDRENIQEAIDNMLSMIERMHGEDGVADFRQRSKTDSTLRAQLRRMGFDPDKI